MAAAFLAYLTGGDWWAYTGVFVGLAIAVRGHWPHPFIRYTEKQIIAGVPEQRKESARSWTVAICICLALGLIASRLHKQFVPERPDLANSIIEGIKKIIGHQPTAAEIAAELAKRQSPPIMPQQAFIQLSKIETFLQDDYRRPVPHIELRYTDPGSAQAQSFSAKLKTFCLVDFPTKELVERLFTDAISRTTTPFTYSSLGIRETISIPMSIPCLSDGKPDTLVKWLTSGIDVIYVVGSVAFSDKSGHHTEDTCRVLIPPAVRDSHSYPDVNSMVHALYNRWSVCDTHDGPGPDE